MKTISRKDLQDVLALTPIQEGMLFHYLQEPNSHLYFEQLCLRISGRVSLDVFKQAWNVVIAANEMLRTVFRWEKLEKPVQVHLKKHICEPAVYDLSGKGTTRQEAHFEEIKAGDRQKTFDLGFVPFRIILCKMAEEQYRLIISYHHIICDGWSTGIIIKEFFKVYHELIKEKEGTDRWIKPVIKTTFKEFIRWIRNQDKAGQKQFWKEYLAGFESPTELPIKIRRKADGLSSKKKYPVILQRSLKGRLEFLIREYRVTLASFFYCVWGILLQRYGNSGDVIFGTTVSGRSAPINGIMDMVGLFINTIPIRVRVKGGETISGLLDRVNDAVAIREKYENTPLVEVKEYSEPGSRGELFDSLVVLENYPLDRILIQGSSQFPLLLEFDSIYETSSYDLTVEISSGDEIRVNFIYDNTLFDEEKIRRLSDHFIVIVTNIIRNPGVKAAALEILGPEEKRQVLYEFNDTETRYPEDKTIHRLFEEQVERTPYRIALVGEQKRVGAVQQITYGKLNKQANRLACQIRKQGIKSNTAVGIMMEPSVEMLVGILSVLKAGGVYLPIDPGYPGERIDLMLAGSGASILLTQRGLLEGESPGQIDRGQHLKVLTIEELTGSLERGPGENLEPIVGPDDLIYIIFTSGSTGIPKGAGVYHRGFMNLMHWFVTDFGLCSDDTNLLLTSFSFDLTQKNFYASLITGGVLCIPGFNYFDPGTILGEIKKNRATWINCTPSMFYMLVEDEESGEEKKSSSLRYVFLGGEPILVSKLIGWLESEGCHAEIVNTYGPTECTDICASYRIREPGCFLEEGVPVGKPVYNARLYVLSRDLQLLPVGIAGELAIGGAGVGIGYVNDDTMTSRKFIRCSFSDNESAGLLYLTGDRVKWRADGNLEFLSRMDYQVKVRGYRIEMGEIENRLLSNAGVAEAVVVAREDTAGSNYLCAYVVPAPVKEFEPEELRNDLNRTLPGYMVPSFIVRLDKLPLTPNGKIDRQSLPAPEIKSDGNFTARLDKVEETLVKIWSRLLGIEPESIGIDDNFFTLGGHSLKAVRLVGSIHKELEVEIPMSEIFMSPTIRDLASHIHKMKKSHIDSIEPAEKREYYMLSSAQKRLYILQQMTPGSIGYNLSSVKILEGAFDKEKLENTFKRIIQRHESLRTSFDVIDNEPVQRIRDEVKFEIEYYDLHVAGASGRSEWKEVLFGQIGTFSESTCEERSSNHSSFIIHHFVRPFELFGAPLLRVGLVELEVEKHLLMVDMHHIISDAVSLDIFTRDFMALFLGEVLPELRIFYKDYSQWQNKERDKEEIKRQGDFWTWEFRGEIPVIDLPLDYTRPAVKSFEGKHVSFQLDNQQAEVLSKLAREEDATIYMVLMSIFNILLAKITGQEDIVVGSPVAGRRNVDLEQIMGMFVNTLALRNFPLGEKSFIGFLREVRARTLTALENQDYPFEDLVDKILVNRDLSRNPLFDVTLVLQNAGISLVDIPGLAIKHCEYETGMSKFDLTFECEELGGGLFFKVGFSTGLFFEATVGRFINYFINIVSAVSENSSIRIREIEILSEKECRELLYDFNDTSSCSLGGQTLHGLFASQVEQTPGHVAVVGQGCVDTAIHGEVHITYSELNRRVNHLVKVLKESGVIFDAVTAIMVERSIAMVIGILGILKVGSAYLPINPGYPAQRIQYMLADSGVRVLLVSSGGRVKGWVDNGESIDSLQQLGLRLIFIERGSASVFKTSQLSLASNLTLPVRSADLVYIIYTSGSGGEPKGVLVEHASAVNLVISQKDRFGIDRRDRVLQFSDICFDASVEQIFIVFTSGAVLVLIDKNILFDTGHFENFVVRHCITHLHAVPSFLLNMSPGGSRASSLKRVLSGGDVCPVALARKWSGQCDFYNRYGPTETTITSIENKIKTVSEVLPRVPIGEPIDNTEVYILDQWLKPVPLGVIGELYIGGQGVSRGYLNRPELTAEKYIDQARVLNGSGRNNNKKFLQGPGAVFLKRAPGRRRQKIYKTGDLVRRLENRSIEFFSRIDHQVKIRGFRIELGEIENKLLNHIDIKEAVVLAKEKGEERYLAAYIVTNRGKEIPGSELRRYLSEFLPEYMLPSYFVGIGQFPKGTNGKIDRRLLPDPDLEGRQTYTAPRDEIEHKLAGIWAEVLSCALVGIDDNFFQLGGHSLKATVLAAKIYNTFNIRVPLQELFKRSSIRSLSGYIREAVKDHYLSIEAVEEREYYVLSSVQKRLYLLYQSDKRATVYNLPAIMTLAGVLEIEKLEGIFKKLVCRHESFRTSFLQLRGEPVQRVYREVEFGIEYLDIREAVRNRRDRKKWEGEFLREISVLGDKAYEEKGGNNFSYIINDFVRVFDLSEAPLVRVGLVKLREETYLLMIDMHHIITDGSSLGILIREFMALLGGERLDPVKIQYKDFSEWWNKEKERETVKRHELFWLKEFSGEIPVINLPNDYPRPLEQSFSGGVVGFELDKDETAALNELAKEEGVTLFMVILALFNVFLARLSGQEDIIVGTPVVGRYQEELQNTIGMFVNTVALRNFPRGGCTFRDFLIKLKERTLNAFDNQNYPFEELVEKVAVGRDSTRNPIFDVMFALENIDIPEVRIPGLTLKPYSYEQHTAKFDLTLVGVERGGRLVYCLEYSSKLFSQATIERFVYYFRDILRAVLENKDIKLKDIRINISLELAEISPPIIKEARGDFDF